MLKYGHVSERISEGLYEVHPKVIDPNVISFVVWTKSVGGIIICGSHVEEHYHEEKHENYVEECEYCHILEALDEESYQSTKANIDFHEEQELDHAFDQNY